MNLFRPVLLVFSLIPLVNAAQDPGVFSGIVVSKEEPAICFRRDENHLFFDFDRDAFGRLFVHVGETVEDTVTFRIGEKCLPDHRVDPGPGGTVRYCEVKLAMKSGMYDYEVTFPVDPRNSKPPAVILPDSFGVIMPFRYVEAEAENPLPAMKLSRHTFNHRFNDSASYFSSSDTILNQVWDLCKYSIKATSFCGVYIDGDRERIPYEADAFINQLGHYCLDTEYDMARSTNQWFIQHPTWPTEWVLQTAFLFYYDYLYTGDIAPLQENYDLLKRRSLTELAGPGGLISTVSGKVDDTFMKTLGFTAPGARIRDIVDWPPAQKDTGWKLATAEGERDGYDMRPVNTVINAFYYRNLVLMSRIAGYLGEKPDSVMYRHKADKLANAFNQCFLDTARGIYVDGEGSDHASLHANMFPLAFGLVPGKYKASVVRFVKSRGMACSVYGAQYLLEGLFRAGEGEYALSLMTATHDRSWWNMIRSGSTITMEAWDMKYKPNADWNHAWGAAPANIIPRRLWGIRPVEPGQRKIVMEPQLSALNRSTVKVPFRNGSISADYKKKRNGNEIYSVRIPVNLNVVFKSQNASRIRLDKTRYPGGSEVKLHPGINRIAVWQDPKKK